MWAPILPPPLLSTSLAPACAMNGLLQPGIGGRGLQGGCWSRTCHLGLGQNGIRDGAAEKNSSPSKKLIKLYYYCRWWWGVLHYFWHIKIYFFFTCIMFKGIKHCMYSGDLLFFSLHTLLPKVWERFNPNGSYWFCWKSWNLRASIFSFTSKGQLHRNMSKSL